MNQTIEKLTINAFAGDLEAQFELAQRYAVGNEVRQNNAEAVKWYRKAAEQDYADAQFELARCYDTGCGVRKNDVEAAKWYRKAAEQGHGDAQVAFASCCEMGKGVKADPEEALKWLSLAGDSGFGQEHDLSAFAKYSDPVQSSIMAYERSITKQEPAQKPVIQKTEPKKCRKQYTGPFAGLVNPLVELWDMIVPEDANFFEWIILTVVYVIIASVVLAVSLLFFVFQIFQVLFLFEGIKGLGHGRRSR